jgi:hypothetical protein
MGSVSSAVSLGRPISRRSRESSLGSIAFRRVFTTRFPTPRLVVVVVVVVAGALRMYPRHALTHRKNHIPKWILDLDF